MATKVESGKAPYLQDGLSMELNISNLTLSSESSKERQPVLIVTMLTPEVKTSLAGGFGGFFVVVFGHPFDTTKVRLQTMPRPLPGQPPLYIGPLDCVRKTLKYEGIRGFFKGMSAPFVSVAPIYMLSFAGFALGQRIVQEFRGEDLLDEKLTIPELYISGSLAGLTQSVVLVPDERIKCLLQVQKPASADVYSGPFHVLKTAYKRGGIRSVYKGFTITLIRDLPTSAIYFGTYEWLKRLISDGNPSFGVTIISGGLAGMAAWTVAIPVDTIKSRVQTSIEGQYKNNFDVLTQLLMNEGPKALYRGYIPVMMRAFVANAACFSGFELAMTGLNYISSA